MLRTPFAALALAALLSASGADAFAPAGFGLQLRAAPPTVCRPGRAVPVMMAKAKASKAAPGKVQVLLKGAVEGVGKDGEVVSVASSYFINFLRPKNLAQMISDEEVEQKKAKEQEERERIKQEAVDLAAAIKGLGKIVLKRKTGADNNIFGKVTHKQIADAITDKSGKKITFNAKMKWTVPDVAGLGEFSCSVQLHKEVSQEIKVSVEAEK